MEVNKMKIDRDGYLHISRRSELRALICPVSNSNCGDWCPKFNDEQFINNELKTERIVKICDNLSIKVEMKGLTDERR